MTENLSFKQFSFVSGKKEELTFVDRILSSCESIKTAVINILGAYTQSLTDNGTAIEGKCLYTCC